MNRLQKRVSNYVESDTIDGKEVVEWGIEKGGEKGAIINHFKVKKDHRRQKLGSKVLSEIENGLKNIGYNYIAVNMAGGNKSANFLRSKNYEIVDKVNKTNNLIIAEKEF
jgi:GNAT superfamily N-acetyltransferase